jgi:hypothetical protein
MKKRTDLARMPGKPRLHDFGSGGPDGVPAALIIVVFFASEGAARAVAFAEQWQPAVPEATFVGIELDSEVDPHLLGSAARDAAAARAIESTQIVLFGAGAAGRLAVTSIVQGLLPGASVVGLDISADWERPRVLTSVAMVRLIEHCTEDDPRASRLKALVDDMRCHELDVRSMVLPNAAQANPTVAVRATGTFLVELVAKASRITATSRSLS